MPTPNVPNIFFSLFLLTLILTPVNCSNIFLFHSAHSLEHGPDILQNRFVKLSDFHWHKLKMFVRIDQMLLSSCFLLGQSCPGGDPGLEWGELSKEVTDDGEDGPTLARGRNLIMAGNHILDYCLTRPHLVKPAFLNRLAHVYTTLNMPSLGFPTPRKFARYGLTIYVLSYASNPSTHPHHICI